jgi:hypothetical protein
VLPTNVIPAEADYTPSLLRGSSLARSPERHQIAMELRIPSNEVPPGGWLQELREMRGRICYAAARHPSFLMPDGSFCDSDPADLEAFHVIARSGGRAVGCARVLPLANAHSSMISTAIGGDRLESVLKALGTTSNKVCEASRWIVLPEFRGQLGRRLVAASWAVARWLSMEWAFVLACTRDCQDRALIHMGACPVRGIPLIPSRAFDDNLRLLHFDVLHPSDEMRRQLDAAAVV